MKKRMILALVLVLALLCLACSNDADDGASSSESVRDDQSVSVAETGTDTSAESSSRTESTSSADGTSGETSTESDTSSETSSGTTTSANSTSSETSTGTESSATSSDTTTSSKPAENSENSTPAESSKPAENSDTSSSSGNPSQTAHTHSYKTTVVKPTCTENGYTLHTCSCGDSYKDNEVPATGHELDTWTLRTVKAPTYTEPGIHERQCLNCGEWVVDESMDSDWEPPVTDENLVYQRIIALKKRYPNGSEWGQDTYYDATGKGPGGYESADACAGFAHMVSNTVFGTYWGYRALIPGFTIEDVRVGDLIYEKGKNHVAVVLEVFEDYLTVVEGGGGVGWGRRIYREEVENAKIETRYDPPQKS